MESGKRSKGLKITILVLALLFALSVGALIARVVYLNLSAGGSFTTIIPDNQIGEETAAAPRERVRAIPLEAGEETHPETQPPAAVETEATEIQLYQGQPSDNERFQVFQMLPGDRYTQYFAVKVSHHADAVVYVTALVTQQTKNLAEVLCIRITHMENGRVIYDGTFADMAVTGYGETFPAAERTETVAYYQIEVYLPTSTGNAYQDAQLLADFRWMVEDEEVLDPPDTGDRIWIYVALMLLSAGVVLVLLCRRNKEGAYA